MAKKRKLSTGGDNEDELEEQEEVHLEEDDPQEETAAEIPISEPSIPDNTDSIDIEASAGEISAIPTISANGSDDTEPESIQKLLEPLSKEQLANLLTYSAEKHPDVLERITKVVDEDPVLRKIFVHGLGWETTAESLSSFFSQFGEIEESNIVLDKVSGKSKGYGFILFKHRAGARRALKNPQKKIGNRMSACQMASAGPAGPAVAAPPPQSEYTQRKIYVSNVSPELDPQKVLQFFAKYGEIEEGPLGLDKQTGKPKGFALFVYKTAEGAKKALEEPHKSFEGHMLHCQKAIDGPKPNKMGILPQNRSIHQPVALPRTEAPNFMIPNLGQVITPINTVSAYKKPAPSVSVFNPGFGQTMAPLLAKPGGNLGGNLGLQIAPLPVAPGVRGIQGPYGAQPSVMPANLNPGLMGSYGGQVAIPGSFVNPSMAVQAAGRGKHVMGPRTGVSHFVP